MPHEKWISSNMEHPKPEDNLSIKILNMFYGQRCLEEDAPKKVFKKPEIFGPKVWVGNDIGRHHSFFFTKE